MDVKTQILIKATPAKIWKILCHFEGYPKWNPFIQYISGSLETGGKLKVKIALPDSKAMIFEPTIVRCDVEKELAWIGHLFVNGLFDGHHRFELIDNGDGTTTVVQSENFTGLLVPLFKRKLEINTKKGFEMMNVELKKMAE